MTYPWAAGDVLTAADLNNYAGLVLVKSQAIGSGVSSVTVTGAFSSAFRRYHLQISELQGSTYANLRFNFTSSSGLYYAALTGTVFNNTDRVAVTNGSSSYFDPLMQYSSAADAYGSFDIAAPYLAQRTVVQGTEWGSDAGCSFGGVNTGSTSYTGFTLTASTGTLSGGRIYVYGYNDG